MEKEWYHPMIDSLVDTNHLPLIAIGVSLETGMPRLSMSLELPRLFQEYPAILETIMLSLEHLRELGKPPDDRSKAFTLSLYNPS